MEDGKKPSVLSDPAGLSEEQAMIEAQVELLGREIREEKARLKKSGLSAAEANSAVKEKVTQLKILKKQLSSESRFSQEAFLKAKNLAEVVAQKEKDREKQKAMEERKGKMEKICATLGSRPRVQRKTLHFFETKGKYKEFRYVDDPVKLNQKILWRQCEPLYLTQKWDGTTFQATRDAVFRRIDRKFSKAKWRGKSKPKSSQLNSRPKSSNQLSDERYDLSLIAWYDEASQSWKGLDSFDQTEGVLVDCLQPYLSRFRLMEKRWCVYFEAVHEQINERYKNASNVTSSGVSGPSLKSGIRVFDFSLELGTTVEGTTSEMTEECSLVETEEFLKIFQEFEQLEGNTDEPEDLPYFKLQDVIPFLDSRISSTVSSMGTGSSLKRDWYFVPSISLIERFAWKLGLPFVGYTCRFKPGWTADDVWQILRVVKGDGHYGYYQETEELPSGAATAKKADVSKKLDVALAESSNLNKNMQARTAWLQASEHVGLFALEERLEVAIEVPNRSSQEKLDYLLEGFVVRQRGKIAKARVDCIQTTY